jgi:hypothetical protein
MSLLLGVALSALLSGAAIAQITVTQANMPAVGTQFVSFSTENEQTFNPGSGGANQSWDISPFDYSGGFTSTFVNPSTTPFTDEFPSATHAVEGEGSWSYMRAAANGLFNLGYGFVDEDTTFSEVYDDDYLLIEFPCTMNTSWTSVLRTTTELMPGFVITSIDSALNTIDGWGNLTVPSPVTETFAVLRDQTHSYTWILFNGEPQGDVDEYWGYTWIGGNGINGGSFDAAEPGTGPDFTSGYLSFTSSGFEDADPVRGPLAESFKLSQNYPNPFNPTTSLPIQLDKPTTIQLTIYNEVGQVVYDHSLDLTAGQHSLPIDGSAWSSGSYFAKVKAGNEIQSARMVLMK